MNVNNWIRSLLLLACLAVGALADTVKLKNGTTVVGNILAETDTEIIIEKSFAGGSIKSKETIRKSDIAEIVRATAEEKAAAAMREAYEATKRYQLDPQNSYPKEYYDQVLNGALRKFLTEYPQSSFAAEMRERIAAWETERDKVAAGQIKRNGQWLTVAEANALDEKQRAQLVLAQAQALSGQGKFSEAIQLLQPILLGKNASITQEVARQEQQFYGMWEKFLDARLTNLTNEARTWEKRLEQANAAKDRAQQSLADWKSSHHPGTIGYQAFLAQHENAVQRAEVEARNCEHRLRQVRDELIAVQRELNELQARMEARDLPTLRKPLAVVSPSTLPLPPPPPKPTLLEQITQMSKDYWWLGLFGLLVLVWLMLRRG